MDRFTHEGDTLIPGAGVRWSHATSGAVGDGHIPDATSLVAGKSEEELEDELPWQLIAFLDAAITRDLLRSHAWREHKVERARTGQDLPRLAAASLEAIAAEEEEAGWLYRAGPEGAELFAAPDGRRRGSLAPNRYARVVEKEGEWLRRADGKWLRAVRCVGGGPARWRARRCPTRPRPTRSFDRPFEARIEGEGAAAETVGEEDGDAEEPSTAEPPPIVPAQRARDLAVGDTANYWLDSSSRAAPEFVVSRGAPAAIPWLLMTVPSPWRFGRCTAATAAPTTSCWVWTRET